MPRTTAPPTDIAIHTVTTAPPNRRVDRDERISRYLLSMGIRTTCFVLAGLLFTLTSWTPAAWLCVAGAAVLPYLAVIYANNSDQRRHITHVDLPTRTLAAGRGAAPILTGSIVEEECPNSRAS